LALTRCIIPAAGLGTRFLPATKSMPKEMLPALDRPVIQYVVQEALSAGLTDILVITGRGKRAIEDHFDHSAELDAAVGPGETRAHLDELDELSSRASIHYVRQRHQRGLADAVHQARAFVGDEPFVVLLGDTIFTGPLATSALSGKSCTKQLVEAFDAVGGPVISVERVRKEKIKDYGIVELSREALPARVRSPYRSRLHRIKGLVEKPDPKDAPSEFGIVGAYALTSDIFAAIEATPPGKNSEVQLTDALRRLLKKRALYAFEFDGRRLDIGTKQDWLRANIVLGLEEEPWRSTILETVAAHRGQRSEADRAALVEKLTAARKRRK